jgi:gas vesicle protein
MFKQHNEKQHSGPDHGDGAFLIGFFAGAALGATLGLMLAPKPGSEFRKQLSDTTERWRQRAGETYEHASETVNDLMSKGREAAERGRQAFQSAREEAEQAYPGSTGKGFSGM